RLAGRRGAEPLAEEPTRLLLHFVDLAVLADELTSFGPEVTVISPPELVAAVRERLARVEADHG
ncbi:MAG: WYL domain-containing protein, partial [Micrococcales bacterium]|nr:WYL domain-containing protein [Micrococcales bacterium]